MRNLLKRVIGRWYRALGGDTVELTREAYHLLVKKGFKVREDDGSPEYVLWLKAVDALAANAELEEIMASISVGQRDLSIEEARGNDDINLARGTLNALALIRQILEEHAADYKQRKAGDGEFNKFDPI